MNRLFRTFFIFLLLLSTRSTLAANYNEQVEVKDARANYAVRQSLSKDLYGLQAIANISSPLARQTSQDLDTLYRDAHAAQRELVRRLITVNATNQFELLTPEVKSYQRAAQKVQSKFDGDASRITDLARATLVADDIHDLMMAYDALQQEVKIVQVKNRFALPKASGYRDLNLLVKLPDTGMIVEVQLHLRAIAEIKSGDEHLVYEQTQKLQADAKAQGRALNEFELAKVTALRQQSHKLYHKAWLHYKRLDQAKIINAAA